MLALPGDRRGRAWGADEARLRRWRCVVSVLALAGCGSAPDRRRRRPRRGLGGAADPGRADAQVGVCTARHGARPCLRSVGTCPSSRPYQTVDCARPSTSPRPLSSARSPSDAETDAAGRPGSAPRCSGPHTRPAPTGDRVPRRRLPHGPGGDCAGHADPTGSGRARPAGTGASCWRSWTPTAAINPRSASLRDGLRGTQPLAADVRRREAQRGPEVHREHHVHVAAESPRHRADRHVRRAGHRRIPGDDRVQHGGAGRLLRHRRGLPRPHPDDAGRVPAASGGCSGAARATCGPSVTERTGASWGSFPRRKLTGSIKGLRPGTFPH